MRSNLKFGSKVSQFAAGILLLCFITSHAALAAVKPSVNTEKGSVFITDLMDAAAKGRLLSSPELESETTRLIRSLSTRNGKQPLLVSEENSVRHDIVDQLALRIGQRQADGLNSKKVLRLETQNLLSNLPSFDQKKAELTKVIADHQADEALLFVDNITAFLDGSGAELFDAVSKGKIRLIAGVSFSEFEQAIDNTDLSLLFDALQITSDSNADLMDQKEFDKDFRGDNISPDIREMLNSGDSEQKLNIILQAKDSHNTRLKDLLNAGGASISHTFSDGRNLAVQLPIGMLEDLANSGLVNYISPDRPTRTTGHIEETTGLTLARQFAVQNNSPVSYRGSGIGIAVFDSGIDPDHNGFKAANGQSRIKAAVDLTGSGINDGYGHGTHVAGLAAGNLETNNGAYRGVASNADIISLKVLDNEGIGQTSWLLEGFDWVLQNREAYNIRVVNLSLGTTAIDSHFNDPLCVKLKELVEAGIVVIAASGNLGRGPQGEKVYGDVHSPGISPYAITVGATNSFGTDQRSDDVITTYSSRGPTRSFYTGPNGRVHFDNIVKPDVVAPGNKLISYNANGNALASTFEELNVPLNPGETDQDRLMILSGTSMSTPIVAGTAALLLEANPRLTPSMIKMLLQYSAQPIADADMFEQGAGMLNIEGAVRLSSMIRNDLNYGTSVNRGTNIALSGTSFPYAGSTIAGEHFIWSQIVLTNYAYLTGQNLVIRFQHGYRNGELLENGLIRRGLNQSMNPGRFYVHGLELNSKIVISDGGAFGSGIKWFSSGVLIGDSTGRAGVLIGDGGSNRSGVLIGDGGHSRSGVLIGDGGYGRAGVLIGDGGENCEGVLIGDGGNRGGVLIGDGGGLPGQTCDGEDNCQSGCEGVLIGDGGDRSGVLIGDGGNRAGVLIGDGGGNRIGVLIGD